MLDSDDLCPIDCHYNQGSIAIELDKAKVQSGGILCEGPKESIHFLGWQAKDAFLEIFFFHLSADADSA
jgi:hypothetical protein